jgi:hypothetical protein
MSHPKDVRYYRFYSQWYTQGPGSKTSSPQASPTRRRRDPGEAPHPPGVDDIGYSAVLQKKLPDLTLLQPPTQHRIKYGLGLASAHFKVGAHWYLVGRA